MNEELAKLASCYDIDFIPGDGIQLGWCMVTINKSGESWYLQIGNFILTPDFKLVSYHDCIDWDKDVKYSWSLYDSAEEAYESYKDWKK